MSVPILNPKSTVSSVVLPATGSTADVAAAVPFGIFNNDTEFISGSSEQVAFVYSMLGGQVLDIELTAQNVYASYELRSS